MNKLARSITKLPVLLLSGTQLIAHPSMGQTDAASDFRSQPNILLMVADDQGYADLGCFGAKIVETPNLDALAQRGVRCTAFYVTPNCSPSRAALLTGRYPSRSGIYSYIPERSPMHLRADNTTLAKILRNLGYATCHLGKWHLGGDLVGGNQPTPAELGFEHSFGTRSNARPSHLNPDNFVRNGKPLGPLEGYACDLLVEEATSWIELRKGQPWFLYLCFQEPHEKLAAPKPLVNHYREKLKAAGGGDNKYALYLATIANMDQAIGRLFEYLEKQGSLHETLVIFLSDNGSVHEASNQPWRGVKSEVLEGGIRVPAIWSWPTHLPVGTECRVPLSAVDIFPTVSEIVGYTALSEKPPDGWSAMKALKGQASQRPVPIYSFFYRNQPAGALHDGKWKLHVHFPEPDPPYGHPFDNRAMKAIRTKQPARFTLIDLENDPREERDVANEHVEIAEKLASSFQDIHSKVIAEGPDW